MCHKNYCCKLAVEKSTSAHTNVITLNEETSADRSQS